MKTKIVIACVIALLLTNLTPSYAQFALKAGAGIADIAFLKRGQTPYLSYEINSLWHRKPMTSFQGGIAYAFPLGKRITFQPEMVLVLQGLNYNTSYLYDDLGFKMNLTYLQFPLLFKSKIFLQEKRHSGLEVGPYIALKLLGNKITEVEGIIEKTTIPNARSIDLGIAGGYAFNFQLPKGQLEIAFRTTYSLVNMMDRIEGGLPDYYGPGKDYARNVNVSILVGYTIFNNKKLNT
jgi:hypothetical protein